MWAGYRLFGVPPRMQSERYSDYTHSLSSALQADTVRFHREFRADVFCLGAPLAPQAFYRFSFARTGFGLIEESRC